MLTCFNELKSNFATHFIPLQIFKRMKKLSTQILPVFLIIGILTFSNNIFAQKTNSIPKSEQPRNIILLIGDGMGLAQFYAAMTASRDNLNISRCTHIALSRTFSADDYVTDSGAGGTAIACGIKTNNGMIGMLPDSTAVTSILHYARLNGKSTGVATTCDITHATPASFVTSVPSRKMEEDIALQFLYSGIDVFIGGGFDNFAMRKDGLMLTDSLEKFSYKVVTSIPEMMDVISGKLAGLLYPKHPPKFNEGRGDMLSLATSKAIELLEDNKNGFFLMVEGSQIDWAGHDNDVNYMISETLDFDKAVGIALDYAEKNKETLVIVTADHETGGFANLEGNFTTGESNGKFTSDNHSGIPVPVFTFGPGAMYFEGLLENTDLFKLMFELYGFKK